jgi:hypothetical protein
MHKYFLTKVKYEKTSEDGKIVKVVAQNLIDALSFTEAEARIIQHMNPYISGEFEVIAIQKKNYSEIFSELVGINMIEAEANRMLKANIPSSNVADKWFECKLNFVVLDEEKGIEKKTPVLMLVHANTVNSAHDTLIERMRGTLADYTIEGVKETKIIDVISYLPDVEF